jgi:hypothetical protein
VEDTEFQVQQAKDGERRQEELRAKDFVDIMATRGGRRFVFKLLVDCQIFMPIYDPDHSAMAWKEGKRAIGLEVLSDCNTLCPELYQLMMNESNEVTDK